VPKEKKRQKKRRKRTRRIVIKKKKRPEEGGITQRLKTRELIGQLINAVNDEQISPPKEKDINL